VPSAANPGDDAAKALRDSESAFAKLTEQLVRREAFGELLAWTTENVMSLTRIAFDVNDAIVRNLRLAGKADINRLARQLARTEDKLELVLQEIEHLRAEQSPIPPRDETEPAAP